MTRKEASKVLRSYRTGEGLETIPVVSEALEMARHDHTLKQEIGRDRAFDQAFSGALQGLETPSFFRESLIRELSDSQEAPAGLSRNGWLHFVALGSAAVITIGLALFFTFWNSPSSTLPATNLYAEANVLPETFLDVADSLYASLQPRVKRDSGRSFLEFVKSEGGILPRTLPNGFSWDTSIACDVIKHNGSIVSVVCFESPQRSGKMHLFTFRRSDFPQSDVPVKPVIRERKGSCCATWSDEHGIHVLYSEKGQENLRQALDI